MLIKHPDDIIPSEITPQGLYLRRRDFIKTGVGLMGMAAGGSLLLPASAQAAPKAAPPYSTARKSPYSAVDETLTPHHDVTHYNNYYEFGTGKPDPSRQSDAFLTRPWTVSIEGLVKQPKTLSIDDVLKVAPLEERIYRMRCVEGWSMVIPWVGFPLAALLKQVEPLGSAKYVEFYTVMQPENMPGVRRRVLDWPYVEGLRLDEAMHPLTIMAVGLYGEALPNQNGAPMRLVVPWKYGFKGGKSIVKIRFTDTQPLTSWMKAGPKEYGFYSNVNPEVNHPRWSQAKERRIGDILKRPTLMFNGYADQVAGLYTGMDLRKHF
jgi:sulfoxide reductase catalytic subunit YedY